MKTGIHSSLRQVIRNLILTEGMVKPEQLPPNIGICIEHFFGKYDVFYCELSRNGEMLKRYKFENDTGGPWGIVKITRNNLGQENCDMAFGIHGTEAKNGYGPLLYDVAMELATLKGSGLVADRRQVSKDALKVWTYYLNRRVPTGEIDVFQCDDENNTLTKTTLDNLNQKVARGTHPQDWTQSPLSKRYSKRPTTIDQLGNKLVWLEG